MCLSSSSGIVWERIDHILTGWRSMSKVLFLTLVNFIPLANVIRNRKMQPRKHFILGDNITLRFISKMVDIERDWLG